jgi:hypothetical protein
MQIRGTFGVKSWKSCVFESFTYERREEVWSERKISTSLHSTVPILEKCGNVAYKLDLPPSLARVHKIFHVLQLKKCLKAPMDVMLPEVTPLEADLSYPEYPIKVLDQKDHVTRRKIIKFFKIQWSNHSEEEATWESEDFLCSSHPGFELS